MPDRRVKVLLRDVNFNNTPLLHTLLTLKQLPIAIETCALSSSSSASSSSSCCCCSSCSSTAEFEYHDAQYQDSLDARLAELDVCLRQLRDRMIFKLKRLQRRDLKLPEAAAPPLFSVAAEWLESVDAACGHVAPKSCVSVSAVDQTES